MNQETAIVAGIAVLAAAYLGFRLFCGFRARSSAGKGTGPGKKTRQPCTRCGDRCVHCARAWFI